MEDNKKLTFKITDDEGNLIDCEELYSFKNEETGKNYIVYTDNSMDDDGRVRIYAATCDLNKNDNKLIPIEDDEEWSFVEETVAALEEEGE